MMIPHRSHSDGESRFHDCIPPELARNLYSVSMELAKKGLGGIRIARKLSQEYSLSVCPGTINHWIYRDHEPRVRNLLEVNPSRALSYVIGANLGDGCKLAKSGCVNLEVTDLDFAETFNSNMATIFSRKRPNKIIKRLFASGRLPLYIVKYVSRQLVNLLGISVRKLLRIASVYPRDFLRGFFDAEGHVDVRATRSFGLVVGAENSDKVLLRWTRELLNQELGIKSSIDCKRKAGTTKVIRGKTFVMKQTSYSLVIRRTEHERIFADEVGFSIGRKAQKLKDALSVLATIPVGERPLAWRRLYVKQRGEWVRRDSLCPVKEY